MAACKRQHSGAKRGHAQADCQRALAIAAKQRQQHDPIAREASTRRAGELHELLGGVLLWTSGLTAIGVPVLRGMVMFLDVLTNVVLTYVVYTRSQETQIETVLCVTQILCD